MSKRAQRRAEKVLELRRNDYDTHYAGRPDYRGFKRPGSTNVHKSRSLSTKR